MSRSMSKKIDKVREQVEDFITLKDVAPWYRGTSVFHLEGANRLLNAIRDDVEQSTSHRVKSCLDMLGLNPMVTSKQIELIMHLSRGNDLAFLWFLMEMYYKTPKPGPYSLNEQLICSAICHLDMIPTLRALEKILPISRLSKSQKKEACCQREAQRTRESKQRKTPEEYVLPYFEKLTIPQYYHTQIKVKRPASLMDDDIYKNYNNMAIIVPNEENRWYTDYNFESSKRICNNIVHDEIKRIFQNLEAANINAKEIHTICDYHRNLKTKEQNFKMNMIKKVQENCYKKYMNYLKNKEERKEQVKMLLHQEIERQLEEFRTQAKTLRKPLTLKTLTSNCDLIDVILGDEDQCIDELKSLRDITTTKFQKTTKLVHNNKLFKSSKRNIENIGPHLKELDRFASNNPLEGNDNEVSQMQTFAYDYVEASNNDLNFQNANNNDSDNANNADNNDDVYSSSSKIFFQAPADYKPYVFDYNEIFIFKPEDRTNEDEHTRIKMAFLEALDEDVAKMTELERSMLTKDEVIKKNFDKLFKCEAENYAQQKLNTNDLEPCVLRRFPHNGLYLGKDRKLMNDILHDAFEYLRKNPKYVWAQLPEAHKIPWLQYWIACHYGKRYSPKERLNDISFSLTIFNALYRQPFNIHGPPPTALGTNVFVGYDCKDYVILKSNKIKKKFLAGIDERIMDQSRIFWFAISSIYSTPRRTFFAYMPSRLRDMQRFRLWRSNEYRNHKMLRDMREKGLFKKYAR